MESSLVGKLSLLGLRALAWVYYLQPMMLRRAWGNALGALLRSASLRAKVVRQNLEIAFPGSESTQAKLFRASYAHLGNLALEILLLLGPMRRYVLRHADLSGIEHWRDAKKQGRGVIFLASHVGNWEVMAATGALKGGIDIMLVTKHLKPEWLHQAIEKGRASCGVSATYEPRTLKDVLSRLKKNGTVGFVLDQYAGPPIGVRVPVFGVPVGTTTAIATLARRTGAPVLPVANYRADDGRWKVEIRAPLDWRKVPGTSPESSVEDASQELAENTAHFASVLERDILEHPDQWLWIHRRFKGDLGPIRDGEWRQGRARA